MADIDALPGEIEWFRYVREHRLDAYLLVGWVMCCRMTGAHEGKVLMRYGKPSVDEPPEPARGARARKVFVPSRPHASHAYRPKTSKR